MPVVVGRPSLSFPENVYSQELVLAFMDAQPGTDRATRRKLQAVYRDSGIDTRHSVLPVFHPVGDPEGAGFFTESTRSRMERYQKEAPILGRQAIQTWESENGFAPGEGLSSITHLIWVSCTGLVAPGMETRLRQLPGFSPELQTTAVNFLGCHGFFHALRIARGWVQADAAARVLVVCTELCTLHFHHNLTDDQILANSLFADGAAAVLISGSGPGISILAQTQNYQHQEADQMAWMLGEHGFSMRLSRHLPDAVSKLVPGVVRAGMTRAGLEAAAPDHWLVHPGGKRILDQVEVLSGPGSLHHSRESLRRAGNLSSASSLFALQLFLDTRPRAGQTGIMLGMGPGLAIEGAAFLT